MRSLRSLSARLGCPTPEEYMFEKATIDSREAGMGYLFFALKGKNTDGHDYVIDVLGAGGAVVVSRDGFTGAVLEVDSVEEALMEAGAWARDCIRYPVIGVTGSSGKTTTRKMIAAALSTKLKTWQTQGNLNNHLGLPLTLLNTPSGIETLVLEMGMNHSGELLRLGWAARPDISVVTNVGTAHIENFGTRKEIARAKAEILTRTEKGGSVVIPFGEEILLEEAEKCGLHVITHGAGGDCCLQDGTATAMPWGIELNLGYPGVHNLQNAVAAIAVAELMGVDPAEAAAAVSKLNPDTGRGEVFVTGDYTIIDESYNANPESTAVCLRYVANSDGVPVIGVLGDMLELGESSISSHKDILKLACDLRYSRLILVGSHYREASPALAGTGMNYSLAADWKEALSILNLSAEPGSTVLVKGSNSIKLGRLIAELKKEGV